MISKLGPGYYNCNERQSTCTRRNADPRRGCPNCEFTIKNKQLHTELEAELKTVKRGTRKGIRTWTAKKLLQLVAGVASTAESTEGTNPKWSVQLEHMVGVYRSEKRKRENTETYNRQLAMDTQRDNNGK